MNYPKLWSAALAGGVSLILATAAHAVTLGSGVPLSSLTAPGVTVTEGDATFSNFTYNSALLGASSITVTQPASSVGLKFTATWDTNAAAVIDSVIGYTVTVQQNTLNGTGLDMGVTITGNATASVGEDITDNTNAGKNYHLQVISDGAGPITDTTHDSTSISPASTSLSVIKDLTLARGDANGRAQVSFIDNTFTQTGGGPPPVPEPMSLALIPLAIAGLGLRKKWAS